MARGSNLPNLGLINKAPKKDPKPAIRCIDTHPEKSTRPSLDKKPNPKVHPRAKGNIMIAIMKE